MFAIGNNELGNKPAIGTHIICYSCGKRHRIQYGNEVNKDGTKTPSKLFAFYKCRGELYLAGVNGKDIRKKTTNIDLPQIEISKISREKEIMDDEIYLKLYDHIIGLMPFREDFVLLPEDDFELIGFDSLDIAELIMWSETEFDVAIAEADIQDIKTLAEFVDHIEMLKLEGQ